MDETTSEKAVSLLRGDGVELELPPQQLWGWEALLIEPEGPPLYERPDLPVSAEDAGWNADGSLNVRVCNIGAAASEETEAVLRTPDGEAIERRVVPTLEAPLDFEPQVGEIAFREAASAAAGATLVVEMDPESENAEIARRNNRAEVVRPARQ